MRRTQNIFIRDSIGFQYRIYFLKYWSIKIAKRTIPCNFVFRRTGSNGNVLSFVAFYAKFGLVRLLQAFFQFHNQLSGSKIRLFPGEFGNWSSYLSPAYLVIVVRMMVDLHYELRWQPKKTQKLRWKCDHNSQNKIKSIAKINLRFSNWTES